MDQLIFFVLVKARRYHQIHHHRFKQAFDFEIMRSLYFLENLKKHY